MKTSDTSNQSALKVKTVNQNDCNMPDILAAELFNAFVSPSILYTNDGAFVASNKAFRSAFPIAYNRLDRIAFISLFDPIFPSTVSNKTSVNPTPSTEVYSPENGGFYTLNWSSFAHSNQVHYTLLCIQELPNKHSQGPHSAHLSSINEVATALVHELNQPLGAIINYLNAAKHLFNKNKDPQRLKESIHLAKIQAEQASAVVEHIRAFTTLRKQKNEECELKHLIEYAIELSQLELQKHSIHITQKISKQLPSVFIDHVMVEQVLVNLIKNAIDAMQTSQLKERELLIRAFINSKNDLQVQIKDQGCGITTEQEAQLFTPFYTTKQNGMGTGLTICRSIIELHGGCLYFERNINKGLSFIFTLPQVLTISTQLAE